MKSITAALILATSLAHGGEPVRLFNGKDLTGWTGAQYEVKDGVLVSKGKNLVTEKQFTNYVLEFEKKNPKHQGVKRRRGHICFCGHGAPVQFKKITILELPAKTP